MFGAFRQSRHQMNQRFAIFYVLFAAVFGFSLYLQACTASIGPSYQSDIERIRWFHPLLVLLLSFVVAARLSQHSREVVRFLQLAVALSATIFTVVIGSRACRPSVSPSPPVQRSLLSTINFALTHPNFSNRSLAAPLYSIIFAAICWRLYRQSTNYSEPSPNSGSTCQSSAPSP